MSYLDLIALTDTPTESPLDYLGNTFGTVAYLALKATYDNYTLRRAWFAQWDYRQHG